MRVSIAKTLLTSCAFAILMTATTAAAQEPETEMAGPAMAGAGMGSGAGMGGAGMAPGAMAPGAMAPGAMATGGMAPDTMAAGGIAGGNATQQLATQATGGLSDCFPDCADSDLSANSDSSTDQSESFWTRFRLDVFGIPIGLALFAAIGAVSLERQYRKSRR